MVDPILTQAGHQPDGTGQDRVATVGGHRSMAIAGTAGEYRFEKANCPSVTVVVVADDDLKQFENSLRSLASQDWPNLDVKFLFAGRHDQAKFEHLVEKCFPGAVTSNSHAGDVPSKLNEMIADGSSEYVTMLANGDIYYADRIRTLVKEAQQREAGLLLSHAEVVDFHGGTIRPDHPIFRTYTRALLMNIEVSPCLSFLLLWDDVLLSPGNIFFSRELFERVGGFHDFAQLYAYDFLVRAARFEEPHMIRSTLIRCRPSFLNRKLRPSQAVDDERAEIVGSHLLALLAAPPENAMSDVFRSQPCMFAGLPWSQGLADAVDGWVETRLPIRADRETGTPAVALDLVGEQFNLLTHELSLSGAPVIVLEMASLLIARGAKVTVTSPSDGPLRSSFEERGISVEILPQDNPRWRVIKAKLPQYRAQHRRLAWLFHLTQYHIDKTIAKLQSHNVKKRIKSQKGAILINSVAAWEWAFRYLKAKGPKVVWFIHESFDPKWMVHEAADRLFRQSISKGSLVMLFGSQATASTWAAEGYPGQVKYWSGISKNTYTGRQVKAVIPTEGRRVLLNVGTVGTRKGTRNLLEAFAYGKKQGIISDDVELRIVGCRKPSSHQETRDVIFRSKRPDLRDNVRIVGLVSPEALASYYDEADIYVHASFFDCMPIGILAAMARGMPIIATDVDGCGEAIIDGVSGLLVQPRSPRQLALAIARLLDDDKLRKKVARGARDIFVRKFSTEATLDPVRRVLQGGASDREDSASQAEDRARASE